MSYGNKPQENLVTKKSSRTKRIIQKSFMGICIPYPKFTIYAYGLYMNPNTGQEYDIFS